MPSYSAYTLNLVAETTIYQNEVRCRVKENDFNYTLNPSANKAGTSGSYIDAVTGSDFHPYTTTVGLYNDKDELLVVIVKCVNALMLLTTPIDWPSGVSAGQFETTNDDATNE